MPADALPVPWAEPNPDAVPYVRQYRDLIGRPMRGTVTVIAERVRDGAAVASAPVPVELVGGSLTVSLPPGTYTLIANLRTEEGARVTDSSTVKLGAQSNA